MATVLSRKVRPMVQVYAPDKAPGGTAPRDPNSRPGNQNARKHGLFSKTPPPLADVQKMAHEAAQEDDVHLLSQIARHLRDRGKVEEGRKLAVLARTRRRALAERYADDILSAHRTHET